MTEYKQPSILLDGGGLSLGHFHRDICPAPQTLRFVAHGADVLEYELQRATVPCTGVLRGLQMPAYLGIVEAASGQVRRIGLARVDVVSVNLRCAPVLVDPRAHRDLSQVRNLAHLLHLP